MIRVLLCLWILLPFSVLHAEDKEMKVHTWHFADKSLESRTALDASGEAAMKAWIKLSKCTYISPDRYGKKRRGDRPDAPEIFDMQEKSCDKDGPINSSPYCTAILSCENRNMKFTVRDAFCKAISAKECPSAQACALDSHITRADIDAEFGRRKKQGGYVGQERRGWSEGHTNRYGWTESDEEDLKKSETDTEKDDDKWNI